MTYRGHIKNGEIQLDSPVQLPEGASIKIEIIGPPGQNQNGSPASQNSLADLLLRHAGKGHNLPADLATHHDFYAHGKPIP